MAQDTPQKKQKRGKLDLSKAHVADGAQKPIYSVYELVGINDTRYKDRTFEAYQKRIRAMDLIQLQDHAYVVAVPPAATRDLTIDRLEKKFLQENREARERYHAEKAAGEIDEEQLTIKQRAQRFMDQAQGVRSR